MLKPILKLSVLASFGLASSAAISMTSGVGGTETTGGATNYAASGSYSVARETEGQCAVYRPRSLGEGGKKHPVILWGNGTGTPVSGYDSILAHWASHGFVVAAATTTNAGSGAEMISCLDDLASKNKGNGGYAGKLDLSKVGTSGHSQGGGGSIMAGQDARITATVPMQPYTLPWLGHKAASNGKQNGPMLLLSGSADNIAAPRSNQDNVFQSANVPVFYATSQGATHFEAGYTAGNFRGPSTAWFLHHLMGNAEAKSMFYGSNCTLCTNSGWVIKKKNMD